MLLFTIFCPYCKQNSLRRRSRRNPLDWAYLLFGFDPRSCGGCGSRFYVSRACRGGRSPQPQRVV